MCACISYRVISLLCIRCCGLPASCWVAAVAGSPAPTQFYVIRKQISCEAQQIYHQSLESINMAEWEEDFNLSEDEGEQGVSDYSGPALRAHIPSQLTHRSATLQMRDVTAPKDNIIIALDARSNMLVKNSEGAVSFKLQSRTPTLFPPAHAPLCFLCADTPVSGTHVRCRHPQTKNYNGRQL